MRLVPRLLAPDRAVEDVRRMSVRIDRSRPNPENRRDEVERGVQNQQGAAVPLRQRRGRRRPMNLLLERGSRVLDVDAERLAVRLACERAAHAIALSLLDHAFVRDRRVLGVGRDVENHEVVDLQLRCATEMFEKSGR